MWQQMSALQNPGGINTKTGNELGEEIRTFFDSQPKRGVQINPRDNYVHTAKTLTEVMGSESKRLSLVIADSIVDPWGSWINQLIPSLYTDKTSIEQLVEEDLPHVAQDAPHFGTVRQVQHRGYQIFLQLSRKGLGFEMELSRFLAPGGRQMYLRKANQISLGVRRRVYIATIEALLTSKLREEKRLRMEPSYFSMGTIAQMQVLNFCAALWGDGEMVMRKIYNAAASRILQRSGAVPNAILIGPNTQSRLVDKVAASVVTFTGQSTDLTATAPVYYESRQPVPRAFPDSVAVYVDRGITMEIEAPPVSLLVSSVNMAEFAVAGPEHVRSQLACSETAVYCTPKCNISLSDMQGKRGGFVAMSYAEMLPRSFLWGNPTNFADQSLPDGKLGWYEEAMDLRKDMETDDDFVHSQYAAMRSQYGVRFQNHRRRIYSDAMKKKSLSYLKFMDGHNERWIRVMGQIDNAHWDYSAFLDYARMSLHVAYPTRARRDAALIGLKAYLELCTSIESQQVPTAQFRIYIQRLSAKNPGVYDKNGLHEIPANQHGSAHLPSGTGLAFSYPPGYNNAAGCVTLARDGADWPKAEALAKLATPFLEDIFEKANKYLTSSRATQVKLAPRNYQDGAKGAYTLAMVITKHRPAMWIRRAPGVSDPRLLGDYGRAFVPLATTSDEALQVQALTGPPLTVDQYTVLMGRVSVVFKDVPLIYLEMASNVKVTNYARTLAMMGGRTLGKLQSTYAILSTVRRPFFALSDVLVYIGRMDGASQSFQLARAFVEALPADAPKLIALLKESEVLVKSAPTGFANATEKRRKLAERADAKKKMEAKIAAYLKDYKKEGDTNRTNPFWMQMHSPQAKNEIESAEGIRNIRSIEGQIANRRTGEITLPTSTGQTRPWMRAQPEATHLGAPIVATPDGFPANAFMRTPLTFSANLLEAALSAPADILAVPSHPDSDDLAPLDPTGQYGNTDTLRRRHEYAPMGSSTGGYQSNIFHGDLPGVRTAELRYTHKEFGFTHNTALHERFDEVINKEADALLRVWASAYALTSVEKWSEVRTLLQNNTPLPFHNVPVFPRIVQQTETGILLVTGPETGANWFADPLYATGVNPNQKYVIGNFTVMHGSFVHGTRRVETLYHMSPVTIEGGAGVEYFPFPNYWSHEGGEVSQSLILQVAGRSRPSLVVFTASPTEARKMPDGFDYIGRSAQERYSNMNNRVEAASGPGFNEDGSRKGEFKLSTSDYYESLYKFRKLIAANKANFGTFAYQTHYGVYEEESSKLVPSKYSTGPRKTGFGMGAADVWNGSASGFGMFNVLANTVNP